MNALAMLADAASSLTAPEAPATGGLSQQQIVLDAVVFILGILILGSLLFYIGKKIFSAEKD